jgi:hypothetical protein
MAFLISTVLNLFVVMQGAGSVAKYRRTVNCTKVMKLAHVSRRLISLLFVATQIACAALDARSAEAPFDYFQNSWSVIGLRDYDDGTRVTPENELLLANKTKLRLSCGPQLTPLSRKQTKTLLDGWLPVVLLATEENGVRYEFTLWATPIPTVKDWRAAFDWPTEGDNFLNWVQVKATNPGPNPSEARVRLDLLVTNVPAPTVWSVSLAPGRNAETCFRIPFKPVANASAFDKENPKVWLDRTMTYWRNLLAKATRIEVPCEKDRKSVG